MAKASSERRAPLQAPAQTLIRVFMLFAFAALMVACATPSTFQQSPNDNRFYRSLELPNGLTVLLISDEDTDRAAASLTVFRGSHDDPDDRLGLAHFLEHMLFLGTDAYPDVDAYGGYISSHGGGHNAYTAADHTNYFFDIRPEYLEGALDRFAPFFISPRFDADYVTREKQAVHSEYQMQLRNDAWRSFAVTKAIMNPQHPGARFNIGSLDTLDGVTRDELTQFFEAHYSADEMALVVLGKQELDTLEVMVRERFSAIERRETVPAADPPAAFDPAVLPKRVDYRTLRDSDHLSFSFPVPSDDPYYERKPLQYIANLLGHEAEGSLHALLTERGWIESLSASNQRLDRNNAMLSVSMRLTAEGTERTDEITAALFSYIDLIREHGVERWRYDEQASLADLRFTYQEQGSEQRYVSALSPRFRLYPRNEVLIAPYLMREFDAALISGYLAALTRNNVLIERAGPNVEGDRTEPWFQVPYRVTNVSWPAAPQQVSTTEQRRDSVPELRLPERNAFIPEDLSIVDALDHVPLQVIDESGLAVWLARDGSFDVPRASTYLSLAIDGGLMTPKDIVHAAVLSRLVRHELTTYSYPAALAGLHYGVSPHHTGFRITLSGYSDKQAVLASRVLEVFRSVEPDSARLALFRDELARGWRNFQTERAYSQSHSGVRHLLLAGSYSPLLLADEVASVSDASLREWIDARLGRVQVSALMHGNFEESDAHSMAAEVRAGLPLGEVASWEREVLTLSGRGSLNYVHDIIDEDDATMVLYLQAAEDGLRERAMMGLSAQLLRNAYFTDLRTEQQLGYVVMTSPTVLHRRGGLSFVVQSPVAGAGDLYTLTRDFLKRYRDDIAQMDESDFETNKQALVSQLLEQDQNLSQRSQRFWSDLELGFTDFDSRRQLADLVTAFDHDEYLAYYDQLLERLDGDRLVVFSKGRFDRSAPAGQLIEDPQALKREPDATASGS